MTQDGFNGLLVPHGSVPELAQALGQLLGDTALRAELGRHGAEIVRQIFRLENFQASLRINLTHFLRPWTATRAAQKHTCVFCCD